MLKKLKSLFIVEDENDSKKEDTQPSNENETMVESTPDVSMNEVKIDIDLDHPSEVQGKPDPKFVDILLKAIEKNNMEGFDYLEYKQSLQSLNNMGMDEGTQFKSAFAMAKTMGATKPKLVSSAKHYINVLKKEEEKFKEALTNQRKKQIQGRESNLKTLEKSIKAKEAQIEKLKKEIATDQKKLEKVKLDINKSAAKVELTNSNFHNAISVVLGQIQEDLDKMNQHI